MNATLVIQHSFLIFLFGCLQCCSADHKKLKKTEFYYYNKIYCKDLISHVSRWKQELLAPLESSTKKNRNVLTLRLHINYKDVPLK